MVPPEMMLSLVVVGKKSRVSDVYMDVTLPYPDAKVASILCVGGPCKYALRDGCGISDQWLTTHVVPALASRARISKKVSLVLAKPVLWACFDDRLQSFVPEHIKERVCRDYQHIRVLDENVNPVKRVLLIISGFESELHVDEVVGLEEIFDGNEVDGERGGGHGNARNVLANNREHFRVLYAQNMSLRRELQEVRANMDDFRDSSTVYMRRMNANINRIALQPARVLGVRGAAAAAAGLGAGCSTSSGTNNNGEVVVHQQHALPAGAVDNVLLSSAPATVLTCNPRDLHTLWMEYEFGIGGRKAAKLFTPAERGACKYKFHRRKVVWDKIIELIRAGHTAQTAVDTIYDVYGCDKPVTAIINEMRRERNRVL